MVSTDVGAAPGIDQEADASHQARSAVWVGLYVSAARCLLTYVIGPAAGAIGVFLGPLGLVLQILGTITAVDGAHRLYVLRHRGWVVYAATATVISLVTAVTIGQSVLGTVR